MVADGICESKTSGVYGNKNSQNGMVFIFLLEFHVILQQIVFHCKVYLSAMLLSFCQLAMLNEAERI